MVDNTFLAAKDMAQELVRNRVEPDDVNKLLNFLRDNGEGGGQALFAYLDEQGTEGIAEPLRQACKTYLDKLQSDVDAMKDVLGWGVGFMRYYRGEGNRPQPNRRPSEPRRRSEPRRAREPQPVSAPLESLQPGQALQGTVRRIMPYGVFVSVGAERDGLIHVSELQDGFTGDPSQLVSVDQNIQVWVRSVDLEKKRISLTMKGPQAAAAAAAAPAPRPPRRESSAPRSPSREVGEGGAPRRRAAGPRRSSGARLFEDEMPKEMTALGEALRRALAESDEEQPEEGQQSEATKRDRRTEELANAHRRTLYG